MKNITYEVPKRNREVFLYPALDHIPELMLENRRKISGYTFEINGIPFQELRDKTRMDVLHQGVSYTNRIKSLLRKDASGLIYDRNRMQKDTSLQAAQDRLCINELTLDHETIKNIPIIQTGHEPILYHPGIWVKNYLTQYLVKKLGGIGVNMIVDNDACNRGFMYVPILSEQSASVGKVTLVSDKDRVAYEEIVFDDFGIILQFKEEVINLLRKNDYREDVKTIVVTVQPLPLNSVKKPTPNPSQEGNTKSPLLGGDLGVGELLPIVEDMQDMFEQFINRIGEYYQQGCTDMVGLFTAARRSFEEDFGVDNLEMPVSGMCDTDGFYHFLMHIIHEAERFAKIYNEKLAEYRHVHKIRSKANPLPDLEILGDAIEIPFWVWKAGGQRAKCYMVNEGDDIKITNGAEVLVTLNKGDEVINNITRLKTLREAGIKIRPRAITTTMFSRLFISDVFIHGIGGAKYDIITDEIIKEFFAIEPPVFVTISATLFLPLEAYNLDERALYDSERTIDDMYYNPERYAAKKTQSEPAFINKVEEKKKLLKMMAVGSAEEKKQYFNQIKELNKSMLSQIHTELQEKKKETQVIHRKLAFNEVVRFREYPFCLYPMKVLQGYVLNIFS